MDRSLQPNAAHYAALATPGCWAYAQQRVVQMEQDDCWQGLAGGSARQPASAAPVELGTWWDVPSRLPVSPLAWG
jgi:hypothetical protein